MISSLRDGSCPSASPRGSRRPARTDRSRRACTFAFCSAHRAAWRSAALVIGFNLPRGARRLLPGSAPLALSAVASALSASSRHRPRDSDPPAGLVGYCIFSGFSEDRDQRWRLTSRSLADTTARATSRSSTKSTRLGDTRLASMPRSHRIVFGEIAIGRDAGLRRPASPSRSHSATKARNASGSLPTESVIDHQFFRLQQHGGDVLDVLRHRLQLRRRQDEPHIPAAVSIR